MCILVGWVSKCVCTSSSAVVKSWRIIDLQCCISFRCIAQQTVIYAHTHTHTHTYIHMKESESEVAQSGPTVCHPVYNLPGSSLHGIFRARILERVAISFCRDLPDPGIEPWSPTLQADSSPSEPPGNPDIYIHICIFFFVFFRFSCLVGCYKVLSIFPCAAWQVLAGSHI